MSALSAESVGKKTPPNLRDEVGPALAVGLTSFLVYLLTLAPTVATNDAGRFQVAAPLLGTGHPTGYPTFILLGKLFTFLPFGDVAYRVNLMSAVFGGLGVSLAYGLCRCLGAGRLGSAGAVLVFAFSATFWSQATVGEVYTMHVFSVALVALFLLAWRRSGRGWTLVAAGFAAGLSLGNNVGISLFAPMFLLLLAVGGRGSLTPTRLAGGVLAFLAGLSVYAYVPIRGFAGAWHNYGDPVRNWGEVWLLVSGARFRGLMDPASIPTNLQGFWRAFGAQAPDPFGHAFPALLLVGGLVGLALLARSEPVVAAAFALGLAAPLLYALSYNIDDVAVYYLPTYFLLSVLLSVAVGRLALGGAAPVAVALFAALFLGLNFAPSDRSDEYGERDRSEAILEALPERAVLYGKLEIVPVTYLHRVEEKRPDVTLRWLDGGSLETEFPQDLESDRPVFFISDKSYNDEYLPVTEKYATHTRLDGEFLISFKPR